MADISDARMCSSVIVPVLLYKKTEIHDYKSIDIARLNFPDNYKLTGEVAEDTEFDCVCDCEQDGYGKFVDGCNGYDVDTEVVGGYEGYVGGCVAGVGYGG